MASDIARMEAEEAQLDKMVELGFEPAPTKLKRRLVVSIEGEEKTGKDHFAFTAPGPIGVQSFDHGMEGVVEKFVNGRATVNGAPHPKKTIYKKEYHIAPTRTGGARGNVSIADPDFNYTAVWEKFVGDYHAMLEAGVRSIIWDTGTQIYELQRLHLFGKLSEVPPNMWGPQKAEYRQLVRDAYDSNTNLIMLHSMRPLYVDDKRTNKLEMAGFGDIGYAVQVNLKTFRVDFEPNEDGEAGSDFMIKVLDCRQNPTVNNTLYEGPMASFPFLAADVIEDSSLSEWQ